MTQATAQFRGRNTQLIYARRVGSACVCACALDVHPAAEWGGAAIEPLTVAQGLLRCNRAPATTVKNRQRVRASRSRSTVKFCRFIYKKQGKEMAMSP